MFNVGDYVTIKKKFTYKEWYHTDPMLILEVRNICDSTSFYVKVDYNWDDNNILHSDFVELAVAYIRNDKLERILNG